MDGFADRRAVGAAPSGPVPVSRAWFAESPIYPILDATLLEDRDPGPFLRALGTSGVRIAQLRAKGMPAGEFLTWAAAGVRGAAGSGIRVVVNDRADVALLSGADGVHLGQDDLSAAAARRLLGPGAVIGLSTHDARELRAARAEPVDYLAIGPVFATGTKSDPAPLVGLPGVREARRRYDGPLVAIGGINADRIAAVLETGADAAAVISAVAASSPRATAGKAEVLLAEAGRAGPGRLPEDVPRAAFH